MDRNCDGVFAIPTRDEIVGMFDQAARRHPIHCHPYIEFVCDERNNNPAAINRFVEAVYRVTEELRNCRLAIALNTRDEDVRVALVTDLYHEYRAGGLKHSRVFAMRKLLGSLGYTEFTPIRLNDEARAVVERIGGYCREEHPLKALGCAWLGIERGRVALFQKISDTFRKKPFLSAADLSAFDVGHDDVERASRIIDIVDPFLTAPEGRRLLHEGLLASVTVVDELWASMLLHESSPFETTCLD